MFWFINYNYNTGFWLLKIIVHLKDMLYLVSMSIIVSMSIVYLCLQGKPQEPIKMKDQKELKPVSMRVRDAAESLLTIILEQVRIHLVILM